MAQDIYKKARAFIDKCLSYFIKHIIIHRENAFAKLI